MSAYDQARDIDRRLNAATDPDEMRRLIGQRRLVRAELEFQHAMQQYRREHPSEPATAFRLFGTLPRS